MYSIQVVLVKLSRHKVYKLSLFKFNIDSVSSEQKQPKSLSAAALKTPAEMIKILNLYASLFTFCLFMLKYLLSGSNITKRKTGIVCIYFFLN